MRTAIRPADAGVVVAMCPAATMLTHSLANVTAMAMQSSQQI
jgi:hypothetical protein